jgi:hypothetical protein
VRFIFFVCKALQFWQIRHSFPPDFLYAMNCKFVFIKKFPEISFPYIAWNSNTFSIRILWMKSYLGNEMWKLFNENFKYKQNHLLYWTDDHFY